MILPTLLLIAATSAPVASTSCHRCEMPRPITPSRQWEIDHSFAHHLAEVVIRVQSRPLDSRWRPVLEEMRAGLRDVRKGGSHRETLALLTEAIEIIEMLVLRLDGLEGEIRRRRSP